MAKKVAREKEVEDIKNQFKRALADYSNLQKRVEEEKKTLVKFANAGLLVKMLSVLDSLEAAAKLMQSEGLDLTIKKFKDVLATEGVKEIEIEVKGFDPLFHEAVEVVKGNEDDKVVEVVEKGYTLEGRVLRPAKVKVSKKQVIAESKEAKKEVSGGDYM